MKAAINIQDHIVSWLHWLGLKTGFSELIALAIGMILLALLAYLANSLTRRWLLRLVDFWVARTETQWDDTFLNRGVFARLANLAPAVVVFLLTPVVFASYPSLAAVVLRLTQVVMIVVGLLAINGALKAANDIYSTYEAARRVPLKGFFQVISVLVFCLGGIVVLAILLDKTPLYLLSGLGALTAVLLIVFKDPILGFVAGIQLSANDMITIGDWIAMPSHEADGDVVEVALTTVKVRNWDKTITTIPTYDLITKPFKNWQGMKQIGGRRISRALHIDVNTVSFCDEAMLSRLQKVQLLEEYLAAKSKELAEYNKRHGVDGASVVNGRRLTNLGTFRAYLAAYLRNHPRLRQDMTLLVRQLAPSEHGLPIQIYVFTKTTEWADYEGIQADIFDHVFSVLPEFGLRAFQQPTGGDLQQLAGLRS